MNTKLASNSAIDLAFAAPLSMSSQSYMECGFSGALPPVQAAPGVVSAWLRGDKSEEAKAWLAGVHDAGSRFRLLFPERYYAPAREAHRLFAGKHLGTRIHFLSKVQAHPDRLVRPVCLAEPNGWLSDPVLNRIPLIVWMMGPVKEVRVLSNTIGDNRTWVVLFKHSHPARLSVLELAVSADFTQAGRPALAERFECTGSDGFLRVNGGFDSARSQPRLELHRAAIESVQRDLPREPESLYATAVANATQDAKRPCELTEAYLQVCKLLTVRS
jgi:predicted dehydrogenase